MYSRPITENVNIISLSKLDGVVLVMKTTERER